METEALAPHSNPKSRVNWPPTRRQGEGERLQRNDWEACCLEQGQVGREADLSLGGHSYIRSSRSC